MIERQNHQLEDGSEETFKNRGHTFICRDNTKNNMNKRENQTYHWTTCILSVMLI